MTETRSLVLLSTLALTLLSTGCIGEEPERPEREATPPTAAAAEAAASPASSSEGVAYEAAYPRDVSTEALADEDAAQQEDSHSHGGEEHSHDGGDPTHDEDDSGDDHDHDH